MCKAPKPPKPKEPKKPQFLRNTYLDAYVGDSAAVKSLRTGRSTLRIPSGSPVPIGGRQPGESLVASPAPTTTGRTGPSNGRPPGLGPRYDERGRRLGPREQRR